MAKRKTAHRRPPPPPPITGVLLVGGKSERMGTDKAEMLMGNHPLWEHQLKTLQRAELQTFFLSVSTPRRWKLEANCHWLPDYYRDCGPLGALATALDFAHDEYVLLLAVDMPDMSANFLRWLIENPGKEQSRVSRFGDRYQPMAGLYHRSALPILYEQINGNDYAFQSALARLEEAKLLEVVDIPEEQHELFRNLNEPGD